MKTKVISGVVICALWVVLMSLGFGVIYAMLLSMLAYFVLTNVRWGAEKPKPPAT